MIQTNDFNATVPAQGPCTLSRRRKAALVVQMMIGDGGKLSLTDLPEHLQELLALEMTAIRLVDKDTVNAVAQEFSSLLEAIGLSSSGRPDRTIETISEHVSPNLVNRLRTRFGLAEGADPWARIQTMEETELTSILTRESVQIGAVVLSKLPVEKAAALLGVLPGERARRITIAMSDNKDIAPTTVDKIGKALLAGNGPDKAIAFEKTPVDRLGAILNNSTAMTRDALLTEIETEDEKFANDVRKAIFTFADIPHRVTPTDVPNILRAITPELLTVAMAAALAEDTPNTEAANFILDNISQRMAQAMREEAQEQGTIKPKQAEEAMNGVAAIVKDQADNGAITFVVDEDEDDDAG